MQVVCASDPKNEKDLNAVMAKELMDHDDHVIEHVLLRMTDIADIYNLLSANTRLSRIGAKPHIRKHITALWRLSNPRPPQQLLDVVNVFCGSRHVHERDITHDEYKDLLYTNGAINRSVRRILFPDRERVSASHIDKHIDEMCFPLRYAILTSDAYSVYDDVIGVYATARIKSEILIIMNDVVGLLNDIERMLPTIYADPMLSFDGYRRELPVLKVTARVP